MMDSPGLYHQEDDELDLRGDVIEALNNAKLAAKHKEKVEFLSEAREIVLHRDESMELLKAFAPDFAEFHSDKKAPVRFFVIKFIEDACKACKEVIPSLVKSLTFLVGDKNSKNQTKVWVAVMNLYRPALSVLCDPAWYEKNVDEAKQLANSLIQLKDSAVAVLKDRKNKIMPIIDAIKTIALSFLNPNANQDQINAMEVDRGPREKRIDTGPDSFTLKDIPRDHPVLSIVELEKIGTELVDDLCAELLNIVNEGSDIKPESSRKSIPMVNAVEILALHRPVIRERALNSLFQSAEKMKMSENEESSQHKLRFLQNLRTNLLDLLKEKWRQTLVDYREKIMASLEFIGAKEQGEKALAALAARDKRTRARMEKEALAQLRKRQKRDEAEAKARRVHAAVALDSEDLRNVGYPPLRNTWAWEAIRDLHRVNPDIIAENVIGNMENLPGPPPPSSAPQSKGIHTFAQFSAYIDELETGGKLNKIGVVDVKPASEVAADITPVQTILPRKMALDRMLSQHKVHVPTSSLALFTATEATASVVEAPLPSAGDVMIARVACDYVRREQDDKSVDLRPEIVKFVSEDLPTRLGLAISTLYHLFAYTKDGDYKQYDDIFMSVVEAILVKQLESEREGHGVSVQVVRDKALSKLLTTSPRLPLDILPVLTYFCETRGRHFLGLKTLRDLIRNRLSIRKSCLEILLFFSVHVHHWVREDGIRCMANQVYSELDVPSKVLVDKFAYEMLLSTSNVLNAKKKEEESKNPQLLAGEKLEKMKEELLQKRGSSAVFTKVIKIKKKDDVTVVEDQQEKDLDESEKMVLDDGAENLEYADEQGFVKADDNDVTQGEIDSETKADLNRRLQLFVALCRRNTSLLKGYMQVYSLVEDERLHKVLENAVVQLIQVLGKQLGPSVALALFNNFPDGAIPLVVHSLQLLVNENISDSKEKRTELVHQAKLMKDENDMYCLFDTEDKFVIPVLGSLSRTEIKRYLIGILGMERDSVKAAIDSIILGARFADQAIEDQDEEDISDTEPFSATELLLLFMNTPVSEDVTPKNLVDATEVCFEAKDVFDKDVLIQVIHELLEQDDKLPLLFMRLLMRSIDQHPSIKQFISAQVLPVLVDRKVWDLDENLWSGFIMTATKLGAPAYGLLFSLPEEQFQKVLEFSKKQGNNLVARLIYYAKQNKQTLEIAPTILDLLHKESSSTSEAKPSKSNR